MIVDNSRTQKFNGRDQTLTHDSDTGPFYVTAFEEKPELEEENADA